VLAHFADIAMETFALESVVLRVQKRARRAGEEKSRLHEAAAQCFAQDALDRIETSARRLLAAVEDGEKLETALVALRRFTKREVRNTVALRRQVARAALEAGSSPL
jgi:hypothetical protein